MKTKNIIKAGKVLASAIIGLGVIHDVATFTPLISEGLKCLDKGNLDAMIYMSLVCGASFILSGILLLMQLKQLEKHTFLAKSILVIGSFLALFGILSVFYMFDNPFAWLGLVLNLWMFIVAVILNSKIGKIESQL